MSQIERIGVMAANMAQAAQAKEDVGDLVAASLYDAATKLGDVEKLVAGRPGSWEADIVRKMATAGEWAPAVTKSRLEMLSAHFVTMADNGEDGGDVVSQAMSQAVDIVGGLAQFADGSNWYHDLINMGRQYSEHWDDEEAE